MVDHPSTSMPGTAFYEMVVRYLDDQLDADEIVCLEARLADDENCRGVLLDVCLQVALITESPSEWLHCEGIDTQIVDNLTETGGEIADSLKWEKSPDLGIPSLNSHSLSFFSNTLHGATGYLSSGWPVAYLIATVIFGVGAIIGAFIHVSQPAQVAQHHVSVVNRRAAAVSTMQQVGKITGMVDCKWADSQNAPNTKTVCLNCTYALASGLLEITYNTGAKVILQGPVTYEVLSSNSGYLLVGKLTGRMNVARAKGFVVRTPTTTVTDLGTEFGIEVDRQGSVEVHVIEGAVLTQTVSINSDRVKSLRLQKGEAIRLAFEGAVYTRIPFKVAAFVRQLEPSHINQQASGGAYCRQVLADKPVAYYRLNETTGTVARNAALSVGPQGTYMNFGHDAGPGNIGQAGPRPTDTVDGRPLLGFEANNLAPYFQPTALTYVQVSETEHGPLNITGALSLEAWVCLDGYSKVNQGIIAKWCGRTTNSDEVDRRSYGLIVDNEGPGQPHAPALHLSSDGSYDSIIFTDADPTKQLPVGQWMHVVATFVPGKSMRVYVNGELQSFRTEQVPLQIYHSVAPMWIGVHFASDLWSYLYIDGRIDEVAIYDYALDDVDSDGVVDASNRVKTHFGSAFIEVDSASTLSAKESITPTL